MNQQKKGSGIGGIVVFIIVLVLCLSMCSGGGGGSSSSSKTCRSCGRTFTDSANKKSISRTNMCTNCYNNFEWAMKATGKW